MNKDFNKYFEITTLDYDINRGVVEKLLMDALKYDFQWEHQVQTQNVQKFLKP